MKFGKLSVLSLATVGALAVAGQAAAVIPVWNDIRDNADGSDVGNNVMIWHSGATASTSSLQTAVVEAFCNTDAIFGTVRVDILEDARVAGKPDFWTVGCLG